ncbi:MAG: hypothetical protein MN733_36695 [Nitrososphaera sp.]|nr:hypothetical protein [Nitrososphaera sp.]
MKSSIYSWLLRPRNAAVVVGSLWAWKFVEYQWKRRKMGAKSAPWGYVINLDVPTFASLGVALAFAVTRLIRRCMRMQTRH